MMRAEVSPGRRLAARGVVCSLAALFAAACMTDSEAPPDEASETDRAPAPVSKPDSAEPKIFGPGPISTAAPEFATSVSADGSVAYFNRASDDRSELLILSSRLVDGVWTESETVTFSGVYRDVDPFITADGSRLFFSSNRPGAGEEVPGDFDLWFVEIQPDGTWGEPQNVGGRVNTDATEIYSTLSRNGHLYFSSDRDGESYIYRSELIAGRYSEPERLVLGSEEESAGGNPAIAPDESFLVFSHVRGDGLGGSDLYVSFQENGAWTAPRRLGAPVSSAFADFAPSVSWDGQSLYWTSERPGIVPEGGVEGRPPGDLYVLPWSEANRR